MTFLGTERRIGSHKWRFSRFMAVFTRYFHSELCFALALDCSALVSSFIQSLNCVTKRQKFTESQLGSIVCATAASSMILIVGRAIQGCGSAGVFSGVLTLCTYVVSKRKLALLNSVIGTMFTVASLVGPVIGGIFAESYLTWRFCFWINLRESISLHPIPMRNIRAAHILY